MNMTTAKKKHKGDESEHAEQEQFSNMMRRRHVDHIRVVIRHTHKETTTTQRKHNIAYLE